MKKRSAPWMPVEFDLADASAIKALHAGTANAEQQARALNWIIHKAAGAGDWAYCPGPDDKDTHIALGRQFVAHQIVKLVEVDMASLRRDPNADKHEPKS